MISENVRDQIKVLKTQLDEKCEEYNAAIEELRETKARIEVSKANKNILESKIEMVEREAIDCTNKNKTTVTETV